MGDDDGRLDDLEELTVSRRRHYDGVDPGTLLARLEERFDASADNGADALESFTTERLSLEGDGREGLVVAVSERVPAETRPIEYRPYGPHGAMAIIVGLLFSLPSFFITLLLSLFGLYLYRKKDEAELPLARQTELRVVLTEHESNAEGTTVTCAGDVFLTVDTDRLQTFDLAHRKAIVGEVTDWHSLLVDGEPHYKNFDDVFFGKHIDAWWNRNAGADAGTVTDLEADLAERATWRGGYTDYLLESAPGTLTEDRRREQADLEPVVDTLLSDLDTRAECDGSA